MYKGLFVVMACISLLLLPSLQGATLAACTSPAKIAGNSYPATSIQDAYDYASTTLGLSDFTLQLAGEIMTEDLLLNGGNVTLDGGYDCSFATKTSPTGIFGTLTIGSGSANFAGDVKIVSTDQCAFDVDGDGYTSIGSCSGTADDCNDNDFNINPGAAEVCDGIDNNCDGQVDEGAIPTDADGDGYYAIGSCGDSPLTDDCNDANMSINPGAVEIPYDGIDQDCNSSDLTFPESGDCSDCHGAGNGYATLHAFTGAAPDGTCVTCHAPEVSNILPGHYGQTVLTAGNNMTAGSIITCAACHDANAANHSGGFQPFNGGMVVWPKVLAAFPNVTCDSCHENRAMAHMTGNAHDSRVIDASCGTCHTSDTTVLGVPGNGTLVSDADVDALHQGNCGLCHAYTGPNMNAAVVRQAISQGGSGTLISCLDCHTDKATGHGSHAHTVAQGPGDLSYDAPGQPCSDCHVVSTWAEIEGVEHNVATNGASSCSTCHNSPRQEVIDAIALGADPTNCLDCHSDKGVVDHPTNVDHVALGYVTGGSPATPCLNCHDAGVPVNGTVITTHLNNCDLCHTAAIPGLLLTVPAGGGDCVTCHITYPEPDSSWKEIHSANTPDHNPPVTVAGTTCGICYSDPPPLVETGNPENHNDCLSCHDADGGLVSIAVGQDFTGGNCSSCHVSAWEPTHTPEPSHGSLVQVGTTDCANCHDNTLLADGGLPGADTHTGCTSCHNSDGSLMSIAVGKDFTTGGDCTTCHGVDWSAIHPPENAPDHTALVAVGTTSCGDCHSDPPPLIDNADPKVHNDCSSCHNNLSGALISLAIGKTFAAGGDCATCHTATWEQLHNGHSHTVSLGAGDLSNGTFCGSCHVVANWSEINSIEHNVSTNGTSSCSTCHNSPRPDVIAAINTAANPTNCLDCHSDKTGGHGDVDHVATGYVTVGGTQDYFGTTCASCHDPGSAENATVNVTHSGDCNLCHTSIPNLQPGLPAGGCNCVSCHSTSEHTLWGRYMDTCSTSGCHASFDGGPGNTLHDIHNPVGGWTDRNSATSGLSYPYSSDPNMWISNWPLNPDCATCHTTVDDGNSGAGCGACHAFPGKGDKHDRHAERASKGGMDIDCTVCHWNS